MGPRTGKRPRKRKRWNRPTDGLSGVDTMSWLSSVRTGDGGLLVMVSKGFEVV